MPLVPPIRRPPLADLRVFEVAARHLSFTRAAGELAVTQGAVSQRVKALEAALGVQLFERRTRTLALTAAGAILAEAVGDGLNRIDGGLALLARHGKRRGVAKLRISVAPAFAGRWLVPRLRHFRTRHPDIEVEIEADGRVADLGAEPFDLAIRFGLGDYPGMRTELLMPDAVSPVVSPRLLERGPPLRRPGDLLRHVLLHAHGRRDSGTGWSDWFRAAGLEAKPADGPRFMHDHVLIDAVVAGLGVALGRATLVRDELADGRLLRPFPQSIPTRFSYYLVRPGRRRGGAALQHFIAWLQAEAAS